MQEKDREKVFDRVLVSVGRKPNSEIPGLETTHVNVSPRGFIEVNKQLQTADPSIYAIGDVVGEPMLAHKAMHEGRVAAEAIAGHKVAFEPNAIPAVVFTDPEVAWCGLTETQAEKENREIKIAKFPWGASGRAVTLDRPEGVTKLIIDPQTERVLGVGIVGAGAGELIAEGVLAIEMAALAQRRCHDHSSSSHAFRNCDERLPKFSSAPAPTCTAPNVDSCVRRRPDLLQPTPSATINSQLPKFASAALVCPQKPGRGRNFMTNFSRRISLLALILSVSLPLSAQSALGDLLQSNAICKRPSKLKSTHSAVKRPMARSSDFSRQRKSGTMPSPRSICK